MEVGEEVPEAVVGPKWPKAPLREQSQSQASDAGCDAQSEGRLTATAAGVLSQQAEIVIEGLHGQFVRGNEDRPDKP